MNINKELHKIILQADINQLKNFMNVQSENINYLHYNAAIFFAVSSFETDSLKILLSYKNYELTHNFFEAINHSIKEGDLDTLKLLKEDNRIPHNYINNEAIEWAIKKNDLNIVEYLIKDHRFANEDTIRSEFNDIFFLKNFDMIKLLFNQCKFFDDNDLEGLLNDSAKQGFTELVSFVLDKNKIDPACLNNNPIHSAFWFEHYDIAEKLWNYPSVKKLVVKGCDLYNHMVIQDIKYKLNSF